MEIASLVVYLKNRSPTRALKNITPYEAWYNEKPDLSHLCIIGTTAYIHIPKELRKKLDFNAKIGMLVGYEGRNQYRLWDPIKKDVVVSRDVVFDEEKFPKSIVQITEEKMQDTIDVQPKKSETTRKPSPSVETSPESESESDDDNDINDEIGSTIEVQQGPESIQSRTSGRSNKGQPAVKYSDIAWNNSKNRPTAKLANVSYEEELEPQTFQEAIHHPIHGKRWRKSILKEYNSIVKNKTWDLVFPPENRTIVACKWVFKYKRNENGKIIRFKSRLVAKGFTQTYGIDYLETYSPVAKLASLRILLAIAAVQDWEIQQMDVVTAFLAGDIDEEIYMKQPEGFEQGEGLVCKLRKSLYGLKQSPRIWNQKIRGSLESIGFKRTNADHCVYTSKSGVIIMMYVDDLLIFGKEMGTINEVKGKLAGMFEMTDVGELKYFLGMQVHRNRKERTLTITQSGYIGAILERFQMTDAKPMTTPMATGTKLYKPTEDDEILNPIYYQSIIGSQMYAMLCTRPDIAFTISQLSQFNSCPITAHLAAAKRCLRYFRHTLDIGLTFSGSNGLVLEAFSDADWGAGEDRKSVSGYIFLLAGAAICWQSRKQSTVALSSTEAEYIALVQAAKELLWILQLLDDLGITDVINRNIIYEDNQGAIALAKNPEYHARTKHIDIQYHFIREYVEKGTIVLEYCETAKMLADALTKPLSKHRHQELAERMGLCRFTETQRHHQPETQTSDARKVGVLDYSELPSDNESCGGHWYGHLARPLARPLAMANGCDS